MQMETTRKLGSNTHIKVDFKIKSITKDKEGHYVLRKGSIQEGITFINIYAPKTGAH